MPVFLAVVLVSGGWFSSISLQKTVCCAVRIETPNANQFFPLKLKTTDKFACKDHTVGHFRCILQFPNIPNLLSALFHHQLTMTPLLWLKHTFTLNQISRNSFKSIKIIYYLWGPRKLPKIFLLCMDSPCNRFWSASSYAFFLHVPRTGGSSKMQHHRSPPARKCCVTSDLLNKPPSFIPLLLLLCPTWSPLKCDAGG